MATFLIALNKDTHTVDEANDAITTAGAKVLKQYKCGLMFLVSGTEKQINSIDGLDIYEKYAKNAGTRLQDINRKHLDLTIDPTGETAYTSTFTGIGTYVYLVDTGINKEHIEFAAANIIDLYSNFGNDFIDTSGHGTAVGSLVVGKNLGAATQATLINVKLFQENAGQITVGEIVEAFDAILSHHIEHNNADAKVVCCPWITDKHPFIDAMVTEMDVSNLVVVCAAGNDGGDVNTKSPAGVDRVITVGAFNENMQVTAFTNNVFSDGEDGLVNYGAQLDIFAMGVNVSVADFQDNNRYVKTSGTSLSTGITAGIVTHYIQKFPKFSSDKIKETLVAEGSVWGQQHLVFDNIDPNVDYSSVNKSIVSTEKSGAANLTAVSSGRILNVKHGDVDKVNIGINKDATNVTILDFAPPPAWVNFDIATGEVTADTSNMGDATVPGIYLFAIRGSVEDDTLVEEFSIGVYSQDKSELDSSSSFYYDADLNEYDELVNYQVAPNKF